MLGVFTEEIIDSSINILIYLKDKKIKGNLISKILKTACWAHVHLISLMLVIKIMDQHFLTLSTIDMLNWIILC